MKKHVLTPTAKKAEKDFIHLHFPGFVDSKENK